MPGGDFYTKADIKRRWKATRWPRLSRASLDARVNTLAGAVEPAVPHHRHAMWALEQIERFEREVLDAPQGDGRL